MLASLDAVSNAFGIVSSAAWLGAQFPQLWTNYRLQSADGLALPFLANWLAGDTTNLIGCILTNQLPFQTYLAVYFVWVDFCLLIQYLYYESWMKRSAPKQKLEISTATVGPIAPLTASPTAVYHPAASTSSLPGPGPNRSRLRAHSYTRQPLPLPDDLNDEEGGDGLPAMTESFHSEHRRGASLVVGQRGRPFERPEGEANPVEERRRRASQTSGRGASLVFLAVFGMWTFGFGGTAGNVRSVGNGLSRIGRVIGQPEAYTENTVHPSLYFAPVPKGVVQLQYIPPSPQVVSHVGGQKNNSNPTPPTAPPPVPPPAEDEPDRTSWTWIIGRISAWTCTTLYLTSRMPQIWKNYTRQSVDGLSISLFVFAFLGNFFYVASILTSARMLGAPAQRVQYMKDCLPYLLGSGGTFVFDMTIIVQSFVYRGLRPVTPATVGQPRRRYTAAARATEDDPLLGRSHRRSQSFGWSARRSPSVTRGRASLERYSRAKASFERPAKTRASLDRGYGTTQSTIVQGQSGA
ncbi:vacuolar integral membrane protein [Ceratobasidium sp. AG-Ba]|nr:vacuolar integral membrane protein [Ceratobasidium sp. AG-Ba]QRW14504.1 vacuolar integral membrane protein [Ceratobasidium sp. AG-Ba]